MDILHEKRRKLEIYLAGLQTAAVAFSSGVDSTFLLKVAKEVLGDNVIAVTAVSSVIPQREIEEAEKFCEEHNIKHLPISIDVLSMDAFKTNPPDRCYHCKKRIFTEIINAASSMGIIDILEGSNTDDDGDYRPGMKAIKELNVKSPLKEAGLSKEDIRALSEEMGLNTWNKPSFACLASRFVYGDPITEEKLLMTDKAEELLLSLEFRQFRVRIHDNIARIEILPEDFPRLMAEDIREKVYAELKNMGFDYVTMDLKGYRTGSMNETLRNR